MSFKKRLKTATSLESLSYMQTMLVINASRFAPQAKRCYVNPAGTWTCQGPWDADLVDHVHSEAQRFIDSGLLSKQDQFLIINTRAGQNWLMGRFAEAIRDQELVVELLAGIAGHRETAEIAMKSLGLMRQGRNPVDMLGEDE